jgi:hypothetical protein
MHPPHANNHLASYHNLAEFLFQPAVLQCCCYGLLIQCFGEQVLSSVLVSAITSVQEQVGKERVV